MGKSLRDYFTLVFLAIIWGSSFILMKRGLEVFDFIEVAMLRIFIAFFCLIPLIPRALNSVKPRHYLPVFFSALLGTGLPAFLFAKSQTVLVSSLVGTLNSIVPLFILILGIYFFNSRPSRDNLLGILLGLFGTIFLAFSSFGHEIEFNGYIFLVVLATIFYALSINIIKKYLYDLDASVITALAFLIIGPFSAFYLFSSDFLLHLNAYNNAYDALGYIALLSVLGTSIASIIFNRLLNRTSAIFVSSVTYLIPIVAIFWGIFDGETISIYHIIGSLTILSGVYLANKK